jgi:hypothetical protein
MSKYDYVKNLKEEEKEIKNEEELEKSNFQPNNLQQLSIDPLRN